MKEINGTVYVGSHGAAEQRVLWVSIEQTLYPSVYTLWKNPRILPLLHTPAFVVGKLKGGADLMTPGLTGPPFPERARRGALAAIASIEHPSVPVAVGTCVIDIADLKSTQGVKGHAVEIFHWDGDDLWDWSTSGRRGAAAPDEITEWLEDQDEQLADVTAELTINDENEEGGGVPLGTEVPPQEQASQQNPHVEGENAFAEVVEDTGGGEKMTTSEIDDAFWSAFLFGVYQQKREHPNEDKYGLKFPLAQSFVMSSLVLPFLPTFTPEHSASLQIKKTSWKNARKFIVALDKRKLLLAKDTKTEAVVRDIDFDDRAFKDFTPYRLPKKDETSTSTAPTTNGSAPLSTSSGSDDSIGQQVKLQLLFRPRDTLSPIFKDQSPPKGSYYTASAIRTAVTAYIEANDLIAPSNKRLVTLDPTISNAVLSTDNPVDKDVLAKGTIPRDALTDRVTSLCNSFYLVLRNSETLESTTAKPKAGLPPRIGIIVETRGGNKTATRVYGFEAFFVSPQPLADELRKTCAGGTSVEPFKGGKGMEVMVQGPQKDAVIRALEKRGVNKQWVEIIDKTKGKKK